MSDFLIGAVTVINKDLGVGTIMDENCQDIPFFVKDAPHNIELNSRVNFEIILGEAGLMASNIKLI
ncbi:hypothetical protein EZ449_11330 [Pedobacter frigidisoli]|uniref:Cold shock protein, CspA family n=1 Tax=Pedobacter frigidisoli TaxID=2530455 RepID=A0A4R0NZT3_9SPHI|nr:hypothetical protein [Pedobacter frigidisoli]TCD08439.1 hypothetical protein EZ449_11330 [Pedobacter frigidisoli]